MEKIPFWKKTWFLVIISLFIPPIGIAMIWIGKKGLKTFIKIALSAVLAFWTLILGAAVFSPTDESTITENETEIIEEAKEDDVTEPTTKKSISEAEPVLSTTAEETTTESATESTTVHPTTSQPTTTKTATTKAPTTAKPMTTAKITTTKKETATAKPTTTKAPTTIDPESRITVYKTPTGSKYHYENPCGNGTYSPISLADAKASGLTPCNKCVLH